MCDVWSQKRRETCDWDHREIVPRQVMWWTLYTSSRKRDWAHMLKNPTIIRDCSTFWQDAVWPVDTKMISQKKGERQQNVNLWWEGMFTNLRREPTWPLTIREYLSRPPQYFKTADWKKKYDWIHCCRGHWNVVQQYDHQLNRPHISWIGLLSADQILYQLIKGMF